MRRAMLVLAVAGAMLALGGETALADAPAVVITGTAGDDELRGTPYYDAIFAAAGDDRLDGRRGGDDLFGQAGNDTFVDSAGDDLVRGGSGDDLFAGNPGDDAVFGGRGNDILLDDTGSDLFSSGPGNDRISIPGFGPGPPQLMWEPDKVRCGPGFDRVLAHPVDLVAGDCEIVRRVGF
ncbi:MAG TPA: calcium-binding protein [Rubrobacteraceae bacterium]|nr:calcium-binding protein [Rubrobacteraceae bacterium]